MTEECEFHDVERVDFADALECHHTLKIIARTLGEVVNRAACMLVCLYSRR
jgi:hypothetical protein